MKQHAARSRSTWVNGSALAGVLAGLAFAGCSADSGSGNGGGRAPNGHAGAAAVSGGVAGTLGSFGNSDASVGASGNPAVVPAMDAGSDASVVRAEDCGKVVAIFRDFSPTTHPDFEIAFGLDNIGALTGQGQKGLVKPVLEMGYPAYASAGKTPNTQSAQSFYQWYVDTAGVNMRFEVPLTLTEDAPGHFIFDSEAFFPLDGMGFGNEANLHNYHFTTELRTKFTYKGGEVFTFRGDDDVWIFVNGVLAVDLGGLHGPLEGTVNMDMFASQNALEIGKTYSMDVFHAERHTTGSNFHIETTIECFEVVKPPPPPPPPPPPE